LREHEANASPPERERLVRAALETNFSYPRQQQQQRQRRSKLVRRVILQFEGARRIIERGAFYFKNVTNDEAARLFGTPHIPPAYAIYDQSVYFTSAFARFGPMCRAAMVLHESIHVIDSASGTPEAHVSEWDEPRFTNQTQDESLHNPSAYASFAAQVHERKVAWPRAVRYGAGRPND